MVYVGFALISSASFVWILFIFYGGYIALTDGVSKALIGSFIKKEQGGTAYGVTQTIASLFTLLASVIGGFLWTAISPAATFIFGASCALLAFILFIIPKTSTA